MKSTTGGGGRDQGVLESKGLNFVLAVCKMLLRLPKSLVKIQICCVLICWAVSVCVWERWRHRSDGFRTTKAGLTSDHVLVIFGEHPDLFYMTQESETVCGPYVCGIIGRIKTRA